MNKGELVKAMAERANLSVKEAESAYEAFVAVVTDAMKEGDKVSLAGFATYEVRERSARVGINPKTKEKVNIPASKAPAVKFGSAYKKIFN